MGEWPGCPHVLYKNGTHKPFFTKIRTVSSCGGGRGGLGGPSGLPGTGGSGLGRAMQMSREDKPRPLCKSRGRGSFKPPPPGAHGARVPDTAVSIRPGPHTRVCLSVCPRAGGASGQAARSRWVLAVWVFLRPGSVGVTSPLSLRASCGCQVCQPWVSLCPGHGGPAEAAAEPWM